MQQWFKEDGVKPRRAYSSKSRRAKGESMEFRNIHSLAKFIDEIHPKDFTENHVITIRKVLGSYDADAGGRFLSYKVTVYVNK